MQVLNMEVERQGQGGSTRITALGPGLNAVCGNRGSGKTTLLRWLRAALTPLSHRAHPAAELAPGQMQVRHQNRDWLVRRELPGAHAATRVMQQATHAWQSDSTASGAEMVSQLERAALDLLLAIPSGSGALERLWETARQLHLDAVEEPHNGADHERLLARQRELSGELRSLEGLAATREGLLDRRRALEADLERVRREIRTHRPGYLDSDERRRLEQRLANYQTESQAVRSEIAELEAAIARLRKEIHVLESQPVVSTAAAPLNYRQRLTELDAQLARWRQTLGEIRDHRQRLDTSATDAQLDRQLGEQLSPIPHADPRLALRTLEAHIAEARRNFDQILDGYDRQRDGYLDGHQDLPATLRVMQKELHEICQQLSRHESLSATREIKDQSLQLARCESELRLSIERLIAERGDLLREIATAYQLSVDQVAIAYDNACRCTDHPRLEDWLLTQRLSSAPQRHYQDQPQYQEMVDEVARLEQRHKQALAQLEEIQRHYRDVDTRLRRLGFTPEVAPVSGRSEADVLRDLDLIDEDLRRLETRDRLRVELSDVNRQLERLGTGYTVGQTLRSVFRGHWQALGGDTCVAAAAADAHNRPLIAYHRLNGAHDPVHYQTLEEVALRLAIADQLSSRGAHLPVMLDETLDALPPQLRRIAVRHLAHTAQHARRQIVVLTDSDQVEQAVRDERGLTVPVVHAGREPVEKAYDVNRQLLAVANDLEADKWSEPEWLGGRAYARPSHEQGKRRFVLTERSRVEDVPSIDRTTASRLNLLGIARVEHLLDANPVALADDLHMSGISGATVEDWQAEARLLIAHPHLRPFDARVLVGAGVLYPRQLSQLHPSDLYDRVESFLGTERGRQIMRSGTSYELSRLTAWLASAKSGAAPHRDRQRHDADLAAERSRAQYDREQRLRRFDRDARSGREAREGRNVRDEHNVRDARSGREGRVRSERPTPTRFDAAHDSQPRAAAHLFAGHGEQLEDAADSGIVERRRPEGSRKRRRQTTEPAATAGSTADRRHPDAARLRFYLELSSPIVDAPSIGNRMAERLNELEIVTVEDLLAADADTLATEIGNRRISAGTVRDWQNQARLVCRIPNLRGHDAQLLVACHVTTPENLARMQPGQLLTQVLEVVRSSEGPRILRGSQEPDLAEITDWIQWAGQSRALMAA
jgi:energy-coupling factor transporter ATP-binding protein EcfA2